MKNIKKILIIIQRSNGDVLLSYSLIDSLFINYQSPQIDLLVNDDTLAVAKLLPNINHIHKFSYQKKKENRWDQEKKIIKNIFRKYDLSINLIVLLKKSNQNHGGKKYFYMIIIILTLENIFY